MKKFIFSMIAIATTCIIPATVSAQQVFSMVGNWKSNRPDCPIEFYSDDGESIEGNCDNGSFNHIITGRYARSGRIIFVTVERIDPQGCSTKVRGSITILNRQTVKFSQDGWNGCGVTTGSVTQYWKRVR